MNGTIIDSPNKERCHGKHVIESAMAEYHTDYDHQVIDPDCTGRESLFTIDEKIREAAGQSVVNVSWGSTADSHNPLSEAQKARRAGDITPAEQVFKAGGCVVYASGNDSSDDYTSHPGLFSLEVGAYNTTDSVRYDFANNFNGLLVPIWANGQSPGGWKGTSFAAPRVMAHMTRLSDLGFSTAEAITALLLNSEPLENPQSSGDYALLSGDNIPSQPMPIDEVVTTAAVYVVGLGRRPDQSGWRWWVDEARKNGLDATVGHMLRTAKANGDWQRNEVPIGRRVQAHYHLFLGREPDNEGWYYWMTEFADGNFGYEGSKDFFKLDWMSFTKWFLRAAEDNNEQIRYKELWESL